MIKNIIVILFYCFLTSCHSQEDNNALLVAQFEKQDCRLEFVEHQLFYNGNEVKVGGQPLSYYEGIFGKNYKLFRSGDIVIFKNLPITLNKKDEDYKNKDPRIANLRIEFYYYEKFTQKRYYEEEGFFFLENQYILIDGIAVNKPLWI